jgi:hypothetical protein
VYNVYSQLNVGNTTSVSGAGPAATYYWRVRGYNAAGFGAASAEASFLLSTSCAAPGAPQGFTYTIGANRFVTLSWGPSPGGGGPFAYTIDVGFSSGQTLLSLPVGTGTTVSVQAPPGTYFVRVRASNTCSISPPSMERTIVVQ